MCLARSSRTGIRGHIPSSSSAPSVGQRRSSRELFSTSWVRGTHDRAIRFITPFLSPTRCLIIFLPICSLLSAFCRSESDDSDVVRTPPEPTLPGHPIAIRFGYRETNDGMLPYTPTQQEIESALSFLPHAPSMPLKSNKGTRRSHSLGRSQPKVPRRESADGRIQHHNDFGVPTLDFEGCLGGF